MSAINFKQMMLEERRKHAGGAGGTTSSSESHVIGLSNTQLEHNITGSNDSGQILYDHSKISFSKVLEEAKFSLENYRLDIPLPSMFYIPDVIDETRETELAFCVENEGLKRKKWEVLRTRKLQLHGKVPGAPSYNTDSSDSPELPCWLRHIADMLCANGVFPSDIYPNNVLINKYEKDQGIMHHTDGPSYCSYVVILSLLSDCIMTFKPKLATADIGLKSDSEMLSVLLRRRSMIIFRDALYEDYLHGIHSDQAHVIGCDVPCVNKIEAHCIEGDRIDRETRISITFRKVT